MNQEEYAPTPAGIAILLLILLLTIVNTAHLLLTPARVATIIPGGGWWGALAVIIAAIAIGHVGTSRTRLDTALYALLLLLMATHIIPEVLP